jgi:membrane protease YdiL (CAAX protease family)
MDFESVSRVWLGFTLAATTLLALGSWYFLFPMLPHQRNRAVPWSGTEVVVGLIVVLILWPATVSEILDLTRVYPRLSGDTEALKVLQTRRDAWLAMIAFPFQVLTLLYLLYALSGTRPYQLGLSLRNFRRNVLIGMVGALIFSPFVYALLFLVVWCYTHLAGGEPQEHPLTVLGESEPWIIVVPAVLVAPILEELLFRGLLQRWLLRRSWGGGAAMIGAGVMAILTQLTRLYDAVVHGNLPSYYRALGPLFFVLLMTPPFLLLRRVPRYRTASTLYAVALLFAAAHSFAWPQPVPLFVLGLGLGYIAYRTQNLLGSMVMHALFNAIACVFLLGAYYEKPAPETKGTDATTAVWVSRAATSSGVPTSWLPRRMYARAIGPKRGDNTEEVTWPTSLPSRSSLVPAGTTPPESRTPVSTQLAWPRSRAMTIGSCPR